jgi:cysteine-rich repeat protein
MRRHGLLGALSLLVATRVVVGCGSSSDGTGGRLCTPDAYVFCRCADFSEGTKQCAADGLSFGECGPCVPADDSAPLEDTLPPPDDTLPPPDDVASDADPSTSCPGKIVAVDGTKDTEITDTTATSSATLVGGGACAVGVSKERVYAIIPTASGKLTVQMLGDAGMDPTLYVRDGDCATGKQLACAETTGDAGLETLNVNVLTGHTYYVVADSKAGTEGSFLLSLHLAPGPFCGDGKVDTGEGCDDANKVAADGCGNACIPEGDPTGANACPGLAAHVWPGKTLTFDGSTLPYPNSYASSGCSGTGQDRVYAVTSHVTGTMTVKITASWGTGSALLYARAAPCDTGAELACVNKTKTPPDTITFPVKDGSTYSVFVDGYNGGKGTFTLSLSAM